MDLTTIIKAFLDPAADHTTHPFPSLRPGDPLTGKVLRIAADGRVLMDFGRFRADTRIGWSVKPGQTMELEVVETGVPLKLRMRSAPGASTKSFVPNMDLSRALPAADVKPLLAVLDRFAGAAPPAKGSPAMPQDILAAMDRLREAFQPLSLTGAGGTDELTLRLRRIIDANGLFFEKQMAEIAVYRDLPPAAPDGGRGAHTARVIASDLKARLLQLRAFFNETEATVDRPMDLSNREVALLRRSVDRLLTHIHDQSGRIQHSLRDDQPLVMVSHQFELKDLRTPLKLKVYYPKKRGQEHPSGRCRLAMLLDLDRLGPVRIDMALLNDTLDICFFVRSESVRQKLEAAYDPLIVELKGSFGAVHIATRVSQRKIDRFEQDEPSRSAAGWIDIQI